VDQKGEVITHLAGFPKLSNELHVNGVAKMTDTSSLSWFDLSKYNSVENFDIYD